jgi:ATP-binding protein involved in chromosome partitioning
MINKIKSLIGNIQDPDLKLSLGELNSVKNIELNDKTINIELELFQPINWIISDLENEIKTTLVNEFPEYGININFIEIGIDNKDRKVLPNVKNIIAVASGKGGVGKSATAANLAASLSLKGAKVGILDGDVYGPSQPTMFGLTNRAFEVFEIEPGKTMAVPIENHNIKVASIGFILNRDEAAIIRGPLLAGYFSMLFEQVEWGDLDFLVFDLPPGTGDIQLTLTQKIPLSGSVVVTTPQEIAVSDVRRSLAMFNKVNVDIIGIVENMSYFIPPDNPEKKYYIFGEGGGKQVAKENGLTFLGEIPLTPSLRESNDNGKPAILDEKLDPKAREAILNVTKSVVSRLRYLNYTKYLQENLTISI